MARKNVQATQPELSPEEKAQAQREYATWKAGFDEKELRKGIAQVAERLRRAADEVSNEANIDYYLDPGHPRPLDLVTNINHAVNWMLPNLGHHDLIRQAAALSESLQRLAAMAPPAEGEEPTA